MINLCPTTFEQASKIANFSEWVRMKIKEENIRADSTYLHVCVVGCQKVTEYERSPMCPKHKIRMTILQSEELRHLDSI